MFVLVLLLGLLLNGVSDYVICFRGASFVLVLVGCGLNY